MKIKFTLLTLIILASLSAKAGLWEKMTTMGAQTIKPSLNTWLKLLGGIFVCMSGFQPTIQIHAVCLQPAHKKAE